MLHLLDDAFEAYLRSEVPLPVSEVDIVFERPNREWSASVNRPTVNIFLWDLRRNSTDQEAGMEVSIVNGRAVRRPPKPRMDLRYVVTTFAGEVRDEHQLLGSVMMALLKYTEIPVEYLPGAYADVRPLPSMHVERSDGSESAEFWTAVQGDVRPGLDVTITATVDAGFVAEAGPPTGRFILGVGRMDDPNARDERVVERPPEAEAEPEPAATE